MALLAAISISQTNQADRFSITDISNYGGSDPKANISARNLIIYRSDGSIFRGTGQATDTIDFSMITYPSDVITILGLDQDYCFSVIMNLTPITPQSGSIYTVTNKFALTGYTQAAQLERWKKAGDDPRLEKNSDYMLDNFKLLYEQKNAIVAAAANDIVSGQLALSRAKKVIDLNKIPY